MEPVITVKPVKSKSKSKSKPASVITESLRMKLSNGEKVDATVEMTEQFDDSRTSTSISEDEMIESKKEWTKENQKALLAYLDYKDASYTSFWINNSIIVKKPTMEILERLEAFGGVKVIRETVTAKRSKDVKKSKSKSKK